MVPRCKTSKRLSLAIAFIGLVLAGITVATALEAAKRSFDQNIDASVLLEARSGQ